MSHFTTTGSTIIIYANSKWPNHAPLRNAYHTLILSFKKFVGHFRDTPQNEFIDYLRVKSRTALLWARVHRWIDPRTFASFAKAVLQAQIHVWPQRETQDLRYI